MLLRFHAIFNMKGKFSFRFSSSVRNFQVNRYDCSSKQLTNLFFRSTAFREFIHHETQCCRRSRSNLGLTLTWIIHLMLVSSSWITLESLYLRTRSFTFTFDKICGNKTKADENEVDEVSWASFEKYSNATCIIKVLIDGKSNNSLSRENVRKKWCEMSAEDNLRRICVSIVSINILTARVRIELNRKRVSWRQKVIERAREQQGTQDDWLDIE